MNPSFATLSFEPRLTVTIGLDSAGPTPQACVKDFHIAISISSNQRCRPCILRAVSTHWIRSWMSLESERILGQPVYLSGIGSSKDECDRFRNTLRLSLERLTDHILGEFPALVTTLTLMGSLPITSISCKPMDNSPNIQFCKTHSILGANLLIQ